MSSEHDLIADALSLKAATKSTSLLVSDLYSLLKKAGERKLQEWRVTGGARSLQSRLNRYRMVKTILSLEHATNLATFYYPTSVEVYDEEGDRSRRVIRDIDGFETSEPVLILGHVGQGKSIFLRYLASREVNRGKGVVPVLIELRNVRNRSVESVVLDELRSLNLKMSPHVFEYLATQGRFAFFFDGFDEVDEEDHSRVIDEIHSLFRRYEASRIIISSRPASGISTTRWLHVFRIAQITDTDVPDMLYHLTDAHNADRLLIQLRKNTNLVQHVLSSPLMVALLIVRFRIEQTVPETDIAFFTDLFDLLLRRHDQLKDGYRRKRKTTIGDFHLGRVFNGISFLAQRRSHNAEFRLAELHEDIATVCKHLSVIENADAVATDIIKITNLILEEGGYCSFVHRSIQEFHAASFVVMVGGAFAEKFYSSVLSKDGWEQVLRFLKLMDKVGFQKYLLLPVLRTWLSRSTFGEDWFLGVTGVKDGSTRNHTVRDRLELLLEGYVDTRDITKVSPYHFSQTLKTLRNRTSVSIRQFESIAEDFQLG